MQRQCQSLLFSHYSIGQYLNDHQTYHLGLRPLSKNHRSGQKNYRTMLHLNCHSRRICSHQLLNHVPRRLSHPMSSLQPHILNLARLSERSSYLPRYVQPSSALPSPTRAPILRRAPFSPALLSAMPFSSTNLFCLLRRPLQTPAK